MFFIENIKTSIIQIRLFKFRVIINFDYVVFIIFEFSFLTTLPTILLTR